MTEPAHEIHVSLTDCRGRNHEGEMSHEISYKYAAPLRVRSHFDFSIVHSLLGHFRRAAVSMAGQHNSSLSMDWEHAISLTLNPEIVSGRSFKYMLAFGC